MAKVKVTWRTLASIVQISTVATSTPSQILTLRRSRTWAPCAISPARGGGSKDRDVHPNVDVTGSDSFDETYVLEPIDPQTNGPQLLYGLRYHTHLVKPGEVKTFHDQVGYWLWEPMAGVVMLTLGIPRGQVLLAGGHATANSRQFEVSAAFGSETFGISSSPFLDRAFRTLSYRQLVSLHDNGSWSYEEEAVMEVEGRMLPVHHTDGNTLALVAPPHSNPLASPPN